MLKFTPRWLRKAFAADEQMAAEIGGGSPIDTTTMTLEPASHGGARDGLQGSPTPESDSGSGRRLRSLAAAMTGGDGGMKASCGPRRVVPAQEARGPRGSMLSAEIQGINKRSAAPVGAEMMARSLFTKGPRGR